MTRIASSSARCPTRSPITPNIGEISVPMYCSAAKAVSQTTDPVSVSTYQPRIRVSISKAQDVARSAGHWKRKLRWRKGARMGSARRCSTGLAAGHDAFPLVRSDVPLR